MAPNLARSQHILTQCIIESKLQGEAAPTNEVAAGVVACSTRTIWRHRANLLRFGSTKAPSNGAGQPKIITPPILTALYGQLSFNPYMRLEDMATFLCEEFEVVVTRFNIRRALKNIEWIKKSTQIITQEHNPDLRDDYIHEVSFLRSDQLVFIDKTKVDRTIRTKRKG